MGKESLKNIELSVWMGGEGFEGNIEKLPKRERIAGKKSLKRV